MPVMKPMMTARAHVSRDAGEGTASRLAKRNALAPLQSTKPAAGVMATKPETAPEMMDISVGLPLTNHSVNICEGFHEFLG